MVVKKLWESLGEIREAHGDAATLRKACQGQGKLEELCDGETPGNSRRLGKVGEGQGAREGSESLTEPEYRRLAQSSKPFGLTGPTVRRLLNCRINNLRSLTLRGSVLQGFVLVPHVAFCVRIP